MLKVDSNLMTRNRMKTPDYRRKVSEKERDFILMITFGCHGAVNGPIATDY